VDDAQARGKVEVHASQSGEARARQFARAMALEQLPFLLLGRSRAGAGQRRLVEDFISSASRLIET
jgi:hypothetical protein